MRLKLLLVCGLNLAAGGGPFPCLAAPDASEVQEVQLQVPVTGKTGFTLLSPDQTGLTFTNALSDWASAENRVLNNGSGVAAGDFDNDGLTDLFFCSLNNGNRLFKNLGHWRFGDVTADAGLKFPPGYYRAAVFADLNGDGWLDLLVGTVGQGVLCFLNNGQGHFSDFTPQAGTASTHATESLALADIDGNGTLDLYVANNRTDDTRDWLRIPVMFVNKKPTVPPALRDRLTFEGGQLQEFGEPDVLYLNDGHARFTEVPWSGARFLDEQGQPLAAAPLDWGLTAAFRDLNNDGAPDLYVCNDYWTPDRIWLNQGDGRFRAIAPLAIRKTSASSMGVDFADINHDGYLDIFVVDMLSRSPALRKRQIVAKRAIAPRPGDVANRVQTPQNTLLLNRGDGTYAEIACLAGLQASDWSWSPVFLDVDLDGHDDLLITAGHLRDIQDMDATEKIRSLQEAWRRSAAGGDVQRAFVAAKREHTKLYPALDMPVVAFRNLGDLHFQEVTKDWGLDQPGVNHGVALADFDNDGDLDVVVNCFGAAAAYRNESNAPRVAVRLRGQAPNTQAIGARVELLGGPVPHQKAEITCGGSYLSGSDTLRVLASGASSNDLRLRISWRDGRVTEVADVHPNRLYDIRPDRAPRRAPALEPATEPPWFQDVSDWLGHIHQQEAFNDFERQPLLPRKLSQNGPGVAWFDLNGDGWDDLLIGSGKGDRLTAFLNRAGKEFQRIKEPPFDAVMTRDQTAILAWRSNPSQSVILAGASSYQDGNTNAPCVLQFSVPAGTHALFPGHTASVGPLALADFDNDGDLDLFVGGQVVPGRYPEAASSLLFRQQQGQWQLDVSNARTLAAVGLVNGAVWSDLDGDGWPELVLACEWGPVRVFQNSAGTLREVTTAWGLSEFTGWWNGVSTGDFDGDGRLDILAGNWGLNSIERASPQQPLVVLYGDLAGLGGVDLLETEWDSAQLTPRLPRDILATTLPFVRERFPTHAAYSRAAVSAVLGERFGRAKKLSVTTLATTLFLNRPGRFAARPLPVEAQFAPAFSVQVADFDGDGNEDAFLSQNFSAYPREESRGDAGRGLWLRGDGQGNFTSVAGQLSGIALYGEQRGAALTDFDKDGRVDLAVTQNAAATKLYHNTRARPGLRVRLAGPVGNADAIGATVRLRFGADWGPAREIQAGSGYWSQNSVVPILAAPRTPTALWVRWPGGQTTETPIPAGATEIVAQPTPVR